MKTVLIAAAALVAGASASAGQISSADSVRDTPPREPAFTDYIRIRSPHGGLRLDLLQPRPVNENPTTIEAPDLRAPPSRLPAPRFLPDSRPITPQGYTLHGPRGPQMLRIAPMPMVVVDGTEIDPKMPMKTPDPAVDYKLHVLQLPPEQTAAAATQK